MNETEIVARPVEVNIKNWADAAKPPMIKKTTLKTYIIDPAGVAGPKNIQICEFEPKRLRLTIEVFDAAVALCLEPPIISPDSSTTSTAPQGLYLSTAFDRDFFGPDAYWLNSLGTITRVGVTKEYC